MAVYNKFYSTVDAWMKSSMSLSSGVFKAFLSNTAPLSSQVVYASTTELAAGNGYATGGATITMGTSNITGTETVTATYASPTWTGSGAGFGPFRYIIFYDTVTLNNLAWFDYGSALTVNSGDTFTLTPGGGNTLFTLT